MTAQIKDTYIFENEEYTVIKLSEPPSFNPLQLGVMPFSMCTGCMRGYWCNYRVSEKEGLLLENLYIGTLKDEYPEIEGILPSDEDTLFGLHLYRGINKKIPYTGRILIGSGFTSDYPSDWSAHVPWSFKKIIELVFENGKLVEKNDQSHIAAEIRKDLESFFALAKEIEKGNKPDAEILGKELKLPDYDDTKIWWLPPHTRNYWY